MAISKQRRINRDYRHFGPSKFVSFSQNVKRSLTDNPNYPEAMWGGKDGVLQQFFVKTDDLGISYHLATGGDHNLIRDRDKLIATIVLLLDQIASLLEAASILNPDALYTTGFTIAQERRAPNRTRAILTVPTDFTVVNLAEIGKALASANVMPGAWNIEIQINRNDPSVEAHWLHNGIFPDPREMVLENLNPGNLFSRGRFHGPQGAGPWSAVVSTTIT